jgi:hypothetical protein
MVLGNVYVICQIDTERIEIWIDDGHDVPHSVCKQYELRKAGVA